MCHQFETLQAHFQLSSCGLSANSKTFLASQDFHHSHLILEIWDIICKHFKYYLFEIIAVCGNTFLRSSLPFRDKISCWENNIVRSLYHYRYLATARWLEHPNQKTKCLLKYIRWTHVYLSDDNKNWYRESQSKP